MDFEYFMIENNYHPTPGMVKRGSINLYF